MQNRFSFPEDLYPLWCRASLHVEIHSQQIAEWLGVKRQDEIADATRVTWGNVGRTLNLALQRLDAGNIDNGVLSKAFGCLREIEMHHRTDPRRHSTKTSVITVEGRRYILVPAPRESVRRSYPQASRFKLSGQIGVAGTLGLGYRWVMLQGRDEVVWRNEPALDFLKEAGELRVGLAPCASAEQMSWTIQDREPSGSDSRLPFLCKCAKNPDALWLAIKEALTAAYESNVQILLFPELVLDEDMLMRCQTWLESYNLLQPRLRLVIAGSRHRHEEGAFANRCTVLDQVGDVLWEQDKRSPFVIDDSVLLKGFFPGCCAEEAFEPTILGRKLVVSESAAGRLMTPICVDYIEGALWGEIGADIFLVPAMTPSLSRFRDRAHEMGSRHGAASFVCNAQTDGEHRYLDYLPLISPTKAKPHTNNKLFTIELFFDV